MQNKLPRIFFFNENVESEPSLVRPLWLGAQVREQYWRHRPTGCTRMSRDRKYEHYL